MRNLVVLLCFFAATLCSAQVPLEVSKEGKYRAAKTEKWQRTDIVADSAAMDYSEYFPLAILNSDSIVCIHKSDELLRLKLPFKKIVKTQEPKIFYDNSEKRIHFITSIGQKEEPSYLIIPIVLVIILMTLSILFSKKDKRNYFALFVAFITSAMVVFTPIGDVVLNSGLAAFIIFIGFIVMSGNFLFSVFNKREYLRTTIIIYYILMVIYFILTLSPSI